MERNIKSELTRAKTQIGYQCILLTQTKFRLQLNLCFVSVLSIATRLKLLRSDLHFCSLDGVKMTLPVIPFDTIGVSGESSVMIETIQVRL